MFAPIFCGQVVTGSWRGFPWRWLTIEGRVGRGGGGTLVSTVWPGQRGEAPPSVASASAVVVSVSSGAWCRLTFTDICTWTADYSHRGRSKRSEGGWGRALEPGFGGSRMRTLLFDPIAQTILRRFVPRFMYSRIFAFPILYSTLHSSPHHSFSFYFFFFWLLYAAPPQKYRG